jgi:hypothetical protein
VLGDVPALRPAHDQVVEVEDRSGVLAAADYFELGSGTIRI